jgi:hypothetical protein
MLVCIARLFRLILREWQCVALRNCSRDFVKGCGNGRHILTAITLSFDVFNGLVFSAELIDSGAEAATPLHHVNILMKITHLNQVRPQHSRDLSLFLI